LRMLLPPSPSTEVLGYFQASLRDEELGRVEICAARAPRSSA
jgi:hypothetical protein